MSNANARLRAESAALVGTVAGFLILFGAAACAYPGGTHFDRASVGHDFWRNSLCDVARTVALGGAPNGSACTLARSAMVTLALGLGALFVSIPRLFPSRARLGRAVRVLGVATVPAAIAVVLLPTDRFSALHGVAIMVAGALGLGAVSLSLKGVFSAAGSPGFVGALGVVAMSVAAVDFALYVAEFMSRGPAQVAVPVLERVATILLLAWMVTVACSLNRLRVPWRAHKPVQGAARRAPASPRFRGGHGGCSAPCMIRFRAPLLAAFVFLVPLTGRASESSLPIGELASPPAAYHPNGDLFPKPFRPAVAAATGLPFLGIAEIGMGITNGFAIGVVGGITPSVLTAGVRPRFRVRASERVAFMLNMPMLWYPKASAPGPGNIGNSSWVLTRPELMLDGTLTERLHFAGGMGIIAAASIEAIDNKLQGKEFAVPAYSGAAENKKGFAGGVWNTIAFHSSYALGPATHLFAEGSLVLAGVVPADNVGGPPVVVNLGVQHTF